MHTAMVDGASWAGGAMAAAQGRAGATNIGRLKYARRRGRARHLTAPAAVVGCLGCLLVVASLAMSAAHHVEFVHRSISRNFRGLQELKRSFDRKEQAEQIMHGRLMHLAASALAKNESENGSFALWEEPYKQAHKWKPCAAKPNFVDQEPAKSKNGFILVSANGGLNQQRVAVCNAVAVAVLLNATLVLPKFLYSSVWRDTSQFGDIYQEEYFVNYLKNDVDIVKELPSHLQSLDIDAIGSQVTDMDIMKEADPSYFVEAVLPLLLQNGVVHFLGFGNRLGFDSVPVRLQRLRCRCNYHALKFVPRIQQAGSLLVQRLRKHAWTHTDLDKQLFGNSVLEPSFGGDGALGAPPARYLALHMRFEVDMVAYSLCDFGGGREEREELQAYREVHFPTLAVRLRNTSVSPEEQRSLGRCPLTPEEAALVLAALGYGRRTHIYVAGFQIYGGASRLRPFTRLYPNLVTKEDVLTPSELAPFRGFSSQLAALDFIACAAADVFAMTDSGSQLSSLVSGYRIYHGRGRAPTLHPNRKRYAQILSEEVTVEWGSFERRVQNMVQEYQRVSARPRGRSIYRQPRTLGCMCKVAGGGDDGGGDDSVGF